MGFRAHQSSTQYSTECAFKLVNQTKKKDLINTLAFRNSKLAVQFSILLRHVSIALISGYGRRQLQQAAIACSNPLFQPPGAAQGLASTNCPYQRYYNRLVLLVAEN